MKSDDSETRPALSITIASWSGENALTRCLDSVMPQAGAAEVIVAYRGVTNLTAMLAGRYPTARFIHGPADASVFHLRTLALQAATGNTVAMLEDHAAVGSGWARALEAARAKGWKVFGGPIDNGEPSSAYDWALYFVEKGIYLPPMPAGETSILSGVNIAYERELLLSCQEIWGTVFYETDVNAALVRAGHKLYLLPEAAVSSRLRMGFGEAMEHLYGGGKHFGKFRKIHSTPFRRALFVLAAPAVPFVLLFRIARLTVSRRPGRALPLLLGLPSLLLLLGAWSTGEAVSYAGGVPDRKG
jgi:hypothetical protein